MPKTRNALYREYYSRQTIMKEFGKASQERLRKSQVAVVGMGGLGTVSSLYLSLAGVGYLRLIDQDTVEVNNLHRQVLYGPEDLHYPKVEVAAKRLRESNPFVKVEELPENLNPQNVEKLLSDMDCVVDGLDNMNTRYIVNRACAKLDVPYVFGAAIGVEGNVSVFSSDRGPCLECILPAVPDDYLQTCDRRGVLGVTAGIVGTVQTMEAIKCLTGLGNPLVGKLLVADFTDMCFTTIDVTKRRDCPVCGKEKAVTSRRQRLAWLCGRETANVNPPELMNIDLGRACVGLKKVGKVLVKSRLALVFDYKALEITLFKSGRMLIKNIRDEASALRIYDEIQRTLQE